MGVSNIYYADPGYVLDGYWGYFVNPPVPPPRPILSMPNRLSMDKNVRISIVLGPAVNASVLAGLQASPR
jgi:hypothetical protein